MSGLLLALDGPVNKDGPIVVATTNCYEKLDNALKRPGRFNHHIKLDWSNEEQQKALFLKYYSDATNDDVEVLVDNLKGKQVSCATLVGMLRQGCLNQTKKSAKQIALDSENIKSAKDVGGDRIDLESPVDYYLREMGCRKEIIDYLLKENFKTVRDFKVFTQTFDMYEYLGKPVFELELFEKVVLTNSHKQLVEKVTEQETKEKEKKTKDKEKRKEKKKKLKEKIKEKKKKLKEKVKAKAKALKDGEEYIEEDDESDDISDESSEEEIVKIDLDGPLDIYLLENNITERTRNRIDEVGFHTLGQYKKVEISELITAVQGTVIKLTMADRATIAFAVKVASERISETQEFIDVK